MSYVLMCLVAWKNSRLSSIEEGWLFSQAMCSGTPDISKFNVALKKLSPLTGFFKLCKKVCYSTNQNSVIVEPVFEILTDKVKIKGVFRRSYSCYGNLVCHESDTNDWTVFIYHGYSINR